MSSSSSTSNKVIPQLLTLTYSIQFSFLVIPKTALVKVTNASLWLIQSSSVGLLIYMTCQQPQWPVTVPLILHKAVLGRLPSTSLLSLIIPSAGLFSSLQPLKVKKISCLGLQPSSLPRLHALSLVDCLWSHGF